MAANLNNDSDIIRTIDEDTDKKLQMLVELEHFLGLKASFVQSLKEVRENVENDRKKAKDEENVRAEAEAVAEVEVEAEAEPVPVPKPGIQPNAVPPMTENLNEKSGNYTFVPPKYSTVINEKQNEALLYAEADIHRNVDSPLVSNSFDQLIKSLQTHNLLNYDQLVDVTKIICQIISKSIPDIDINIIRHATKPDSYESSKRPNQRYSQILFGENREMTVIYYDPNAVRNPIYAIPYQNGSKWLEGQMDISKKLYEGIVNNKNPLSKLKWLKDIPRPRCPDGGLKCDCSIVFGICYAILFAKNLNYDVFKDHIPIDTETEHGTKIIREKLKEMFDNKSLDI